MEEKSQILEILSDGSWHDREHLSAQLGISGSELEVQLDSLRRSHPELRQVPELGICLPREPQRYDRRLLEALAGGPVEVFDTIGSTNDAARELFEQGAPHGAAALADQQTAGRGRMGRPFVSPSGTGIYVSVLLTAPAALENAHLVTPAAAVVTAGILERFTRAEIGIKWVNDLLLDGRKICGILTEASLDLETGSPEYVILGVGVNLYSAGFPEELQPIAGALYQKLPQGMTRGRFAAGLLAALLDLSSQCIQPWVIQEYRARCPMVGQTVQIVGSGRQGVVEAITDQCGLRLRFADGTEEEMQSGEVSVRPVEG